MVTIADLHGGYGRHTVLHGISFNMSRGELFGIIGPNGSGKTTLLRALTNGIRRTGGRVECEGRDVSTVSARQLAGRLAMVQQQNDIPFAMTVEEFVALGRLPFQAPLQFFESAADRAIITQAMTMSGCEQFRARPLATLSSGERQLVLIAKALAQQPVLLLLDEPVAYLDISHQVQLLSLVRRLNRRHRMSVIVVLHELNLAAEYCDRILLLQHGTVRACGTPQEVFRRAVIEEVYDIPVIVQEHPCSRKPVVLAVDRQYHPTQPAKERRNRSGIPEE